MLSTVFGLMTTEEAARLVCHSCDPSGSTAFTRLPDGTAIGPANTRTRQIKNTGDFDVAVDFNQFGFRERKPLAPTRAGSLFVVGDSFAFGWGVDETQRFSNRLETLLGRPVFNIAAGSANFDGYETLVRYAESQGTHVDPVIVSVCMENDVSVYDAAPSRSPQMVVEERIPFTTPEGLKYWLAQHSALRFAVTRAVHSTPWLKGAAIKAGLVIPNTVVGESDISDEAVASSAARLSRLFGARAGIVLIIPSRGLWMGHDDHRRAIERAHESFVRQVQDLGIAVVDVRPLFEQGGHPLAYHFANDGHWNAEGHAIAAEALSRYLKAHSS